MKFEEDGPITTPAGDDVVKVPATEKPCCTIADEMTRRAEEIDAYVKAGGSTVGVIFVLHASGQNGPKSFFYKG